MPSALQLVDSVLPQSKIEIILTAGLLGLLGILSSIYLVLLTRSDLHHPLSTYLDPNYSFINREKIIHNSKLIDPRSNMLSKFVLLFVAPLSIVAVEFGVLVPKQNNAGSIPTTGGWSLQANTCPTGTSTCGAAWCCLNSLTCVRSGNSDNAEACCPTGDISLFLSISTGN